MKTLLLVVVALGLVAPPVHAFPHHHAPYIINSNGTAVQVTGPSQPAAPPVVTPPVPPVVTPPMPPVVTPPVPPVVVPPVVTPPVVTPPVVTPPVVTPPVVTPPSDTVIGSDWADRELAQLNAFRLQNGVAPLRLNDALSRGAAAFSAYMGIAGFYSHNGPDGSTPPSRMAGVGVVGTGWWGENIAAADSSVEQTMAAWEASPDHRANMLNPNFTDVGIGIAYVPGSPWGFYWTQDFIQTR